MVQIKIYMENAGGSHRCLLISMRKYMCYTYYNLILGA